MPDGQYLIALLSCLMAATFDRPAPVEQDILVSSHHMSSFPHTSRCVCIKTSCSVHVGRTGEESPAGGAVTAGVSSKDLFM